MANNNSNGNSLFKNDNQEEYKFENTLSLEDIRSAHRKFCEERNWGQFHAPRNILLAMVGEVGELSELFQWKGEVGVGLPEFTSKEKERVGEELSDVLIYLVDLAAQCHIDLPAAVKRKMALNAEKYPVDKAFGRSDRYDTYDEIQLEREEADGKE